VYNILDYIESSWGLGMALFPVQRFIVKLYYFIPLDNTTKNIRVTDMFNSRVLYEFTEVEYLEYLFNEGRCSIKTQDHERRELILAIGRRAGKCCEEGTYVLTHTGLRKIEDLGDSEGPEFQPLQVTVAQEGGRRAPSALFYNGGQRDTVRVRTRCGYAIGGTPNHRVKVLAEDGTIQWRFLGDVRMGDVLCVHRKTDLWADVGPDLRSFHKGLAGGKDVDLPASLTEDWTTLLGVLVGDGTWGMPGGLEVTVGPYVEWLQQVVDLFGRTLGPTTTLKVTTQGRISYRVRFFSRKTRTFFDRLGYSLKTDSTAKRVPWVVMQSPKSLVAAFLRGLFETDGGVERGRIVSFSTASAGLASDVQTLLLNFGIVSRVKARVNAKYQRTYHHLTILGGDSLRLFAEQIGFLSERKSGALRPHTAKGDQGNKSATEAIPYQRTWCRRLLESVPKNNGNAHVNKLGWRRSLLRVALGNVLKNTTEDMSYPRLRAAVAVAREVGADAEVVRHFDDLLSSGYFFDPVVSVTPGQSRVYDLTVPDGESFVANGFTNHNSTLAGIFASYEVYRLLNLQHPQGYYGLPPGNRIQIISIGTDKDQAGILFNEVTSHLSRCEYFKSFIANNTQSYIQFRTPHDIDRYGGTVRHENGKFVSFNGKATIRVTFKSCIAKGLRGFGNIVIILDEMAHFQAEGQSSAKDIYDAISPSTAAFSPKGEDGMPLVLPDGTTAPVESRIICISSPLNKAGKFFDLYHQAMAGGEGSKNMLAIQAPTWEVNPTVQTDYYRQKYHADPTVFMTEHGAQFSDRVRGWIEREEDLVACIDQDHRPIDHGIPRHPYQLGLDVGLVGDGTCVAITHVEGDKIVLDYHELWRAGVDWRESNPHLGNNYSCDYAKSLATVARLDFDEIGQWIIGLTSKFYITDGIFDRWNGIPLEQAFVKAGLRQFKSEFFTKDSSSKIYQSAKLMIYDERLMLYDHPKGANGKYSPLIEELLQLQATQVSKNIVSVEAPDQVGCHDDVSDALVRAIWLSAQRLSSSAIATGVVRGGGIPGQRSSASVGKYQLARARQHGGFTERTVSKSLGLRLRGR
jgi:intein/homing endonuclease